MNHRVLARLLVGLLMAAPLCAPAGQDSRFHWPNGAKAAVSLAYDDALDSQLDNAIPALNRYGFHGSFYLTLANPSVRFRVQDWRDAARLGHELGNHTLFHSCSGSRPGREWVEPWNDLDSMPVEEVKQHILLANALLHAIDGREERTFTTPCGDLQASDGYYLDAVKSQFVAIKALFPEGVTPDMKTLDPYLVSVATPVNASGDELIAIVRAAAEQGSMANLTFHGVGGDYLAVSEEAHEQLLRYLAEHRDAYWVDTFLNIMRYVKAQRPPE
jgi:peptidoglycan/xylan/chitin deacetylase (PgdA/CDA1 family)